MISCTLDAMLACGVWCSLTRPMISFSPIVANSGNASLKANTVTSPSCTVQSASTIRPYFRWEMVAWKSLLFPSLIVLFKRQTELLSTSFCYLHSANSAKELQARFFVPIRGGRPSCTCVKV